MTHPESQSGSDALPAANAPSDAGRMREAPLSFFAENVDLWGAADWFDRLAKAIREQDRSVLAKDEAAAETCRNIAASSAMRLVREHEQVVRAALSPDAAPAVEGAWNATVHDDIIKRLMAQVGHPNSTSLYVAFKQFANELHALAQPVADGLGPVAWRYRFVVSVHRDWSDWFIVDDAKSIPNRPLPDLEIQPLYAHPQPAAAVNAEAIKRAYIQGWNGAFEKGADHPQRHQAGLAAILALIKDGSHGG